MSATLMNELLNLSFYSARRRRHPILVTRPLKRFVRARGLRRAQPLFFFVETISRN